MTSNATRRARLRAGEPVENISHNVKAWGPGSFVVNMDEPNKTTNA